ncbi:Protein ENL [Myotis davidii]|uniref:Protein ENL n=1 Tax=Myotis davidii TaxID=225400 RepID=L5LUT3_MYODS|nr:Protein ENL [Myotis davidii]
MPASFSHQCTVQVKLELGHRAQLRKKPTTEGFTHDWMVFVRGPEQCDIQHFVEKVVFWLHDSFPKPKRVCKEPPYKVEESGYAGFIMPIEVHFKNKDVGRCALQAARLSPLFLMVVLSSEMDSAHTRGLGYSEAREPSGDVCLMAFDILSAAAEAGEAPATATALTSPEPSSGLLAEWRSPCRSTLTTGGSSYIEHLPPGEREPLICCLLHAPYWESSRQLGMCPDQGLNHDLLVHRSTLNY